MSSNLFLVYFFSLARAIKKLFVVDVPWGPCMMVNVASERTWVQILAVHSQPCESREGSSLGHWTSFCW